MSKLRLYIIFKHTSSVESSISDATSEDINTELNVCVHVYNSYTVMYIAR